MTSKISCIKFIKEDLRQRTWLIAILSTVTFLFQPLMLIIGINEKKNWINTVSPGFTMKDFKFWLFNFMGFNNNAVVFCVILFAILWWGVWFLLSAFQRKTKSYTQFANPT